MKFTNKRSPRSYEALDGIECAQLIMAGKVYDGRKLPVQTRLDEHAPAEFDDPNFSGSFEIWDVLDQEGSLAYTAMFYKGDSGVIFKSGTAISVAEIIQGYLECVDAGLYSTLAAAIEDAKGNGEDHPRFDYRL